MQQPASINLKDRIITALTDPDAELWFPDLTYDLVQSGFERLFDETGITESRYGTARVILKDKSTDRSGKSNLFTDNEIFLEFLPEVINEKYRKSGADFYTREEVFSNTDILDCVRDAFNIISQVPSLFASVCHLVKSIHLIKPDDDDYDVSFSEPYIPFSIFVSIPQKNTPIIALRVAEAIVHEAMHLQLTLIENIVQLVVPGGELIYSPWKEELRTAQGVMHGLYVFQVLQFFFFKLLSYKSFLAYEMVYLEERKKLISHQVIEIRNFKICPNLTNLGRDFTRSQIEIS